MAYKKHKPRRKRQKASMDISKMANNAMNMTMSITAMGVTGAVGAKLIDSIGK